MLCERKSVNSYIIILKRSYIFKGINCNLELIETENLCIECVYIEKTTKKLLETK